MAFFNFLNSEKHRAFSFHLVRLLRLFFIIRSDWLLDDYYIHTRGSPFLHERAMKQQV